MPKGRTYRLLNSDIQKFMSSVTDGEKEEFLQFLKERADAGKSAEEALE